jgi:Cyclin, N-terminal domain
MNHHDPRFANENKNYEYRQKERKQRFQELIGRVVHKPVQPPRKSVDAFEPGEKQKNQVPSELDSLGRRMLGQVNHMPDPHKRSPNKHKGLKHPPPKNLEEKNQAMKLGKMFAPFLFDESKKERLPQEMEFQDEILEYLMEIEKNEICKVYYGLAPEKKPWITEVKRLHLMDWMIDLFDMFTRRKLGLTFPVRHDTIFLAISIMDRYFSRETIPVGKQLLAAATCLFMALKFEEVVLIEISDFLRLFDCSNTREDFIEMEARIIEILEFKISLVNTNNLLAHVMGKDSWGKEKCHLGYFLLYALTIDLELVSLSPSRTVKVIKDNLSIFAMRDTLQKANLSDEEMAIQNKLIRSVVMSKQQLTNRPRAINLLIRISK